MTKGLRYHWPLHRPIKMLQLLRENKLYTKQTSAFVNRIGSKDFNCLVALASVSCEPKPMPPTVEMNRKQALKPLN